MLKVYNLTVFLIIIFSLTIPTITAVLSVCSTVKSFYEIVWEKQTRLESYNYRNCGYVYCSDEVRYHQVPYDVSKKQQRFETEQFCCPGYRQVQPSPSLKCEPICDPPCMHAECSQPGKCECHFGYTPSLFNNVCEPLCEDECKNSTCTNYNECTCLKGYRKHHYMNSICIPSCEYCINGDCVAPETCLCHKGFEIVYDESSKINKCVPVCQAECINSVCVGKNECDCRTGYVPSDIWNVCVPYCDNCENALCVEPKKCECFNGFEEIPGEPNACSPICNKTCDFGFCSYPNTCSCWVGYNPSSNNSDICEPSCLNCENGNCIAPGFCSCWEGYERNNNSCEPICNNSCKNGICSAPDTCQCLPNTINVNNNECLNVCQSNEDTNCSRVVEIPMDSVQNFNSKYLIIKNDNINFTVLMPCDFLFNKTINEKCGEHNSVCYPVVEDDFKIVCQFLDSELNFNQEDLLVENETLIYRKNYSLAFLYNNQGNNAEQCKLCLCPNSTRTLHLDKSTKLAFQLCASQEPDQHHSHHNNTIAVIVLGSLLVLTSVVAVMLIIILCYQRYIFSRGTYFMHELEDGG